MATIETKVFLGDSGCLTVHSLLHGFWERRQKLSELSGFCPHVYSLHNERDIPFSPVDALWLGDTCAAVRFLLQWESV